MARRIFRIIGIVILAVIVLVAALLLWLTAAEYKPAAVENVDIAAAAAAGTQPTVGDSISVLSWNIGYAGLGKDSDFFMLRDDYGYPVLSVDRPYDISSSIGQMRTRVQAFVESIEIKKLQGGAEQCQK